MYKVSAEELNLFRKCYRQTILIKVFGIDGLTELTEADILENGLTVDRYCFSSGKLEIGSAVASELSVKLDNHLGKFDTVDFDGAVFSVSVGIKKWDAKQWENAALYHIPLGIFTVDDITKDESSITLNALDNMVKFDKPFDSDITFPTTVGDLLQKACTACGVLPQTTDFPNASYRVIECPEGDDLTWRQIVQWIAEIAGTNAWVDWNGHLRLTWFEDTDIEITSFDRYSSETEEYSVTVTGVQIVDTNNEKSLAGFTGCVLNIEGNKLIQQNTGALAQRIYGIVEGFQYLPYSCTTRAFPFLFPMDTLVYVDKKGVRHKTIVSAVTYTVNGAMSLAGEGVGKTENERSPASGTTKQEKLIIEKVKQSLEKDSAGKYSTLVNLNQTIGGAFGLYQTEAERDGVKSLYFHDKPTLEDSTIIYTFNSGGFAWTDAWQKGSPIWKYGFTQGGNAVFHILAAYKIQADYLEAGCVTAEKISTSYKTSVENAISDGDAAVSQAFAAADGQLRSLITAETTRADGVEQTLASAIQQNATAISAKVSATGGTASSFAWSLTAGGFTLTANGAEVMKVTSKGATVSGKIISDDVSITGGSITLGDEASGVTEISTAGAHFGVPSVFTDIFAATTRVGWYQTSGDGGHERNCLYIGNLPSSKSLLWTFVSDRHGLQANLTPSDCNKFYIGAYPQYSRTGINGSISVGLTFVMSDKIDDCYTELEGVWKGDITSTSDRNLKNSIEGLSDKYDNFFDRLSPVRFKFNNGASGRFHTGFVAQDVETAIESAGLSTDDAALYVRLTDNDPSLDSPAVTYGLRYTEFISLNTWQIQKLKARVAKLERMVNHDE